MSRPDDDLRLIARDRELPGLRTVLDPDTFLDWIRRQWPDAGIQIARPHYVRYKPGTSCLVTYALEWTGGTSLVTAKSLRPPASDKLTKITRFCTERTPLGAAAAVTPECALAATVLPYDPRLPALRRLLKRVPGRILEALVPGAREGARVHLLSYKPERRAVVRVEGAGAGAVVRIYSEREFASLVGHRLLAQPETVRLARTLRSVKQYRAIATEWLEGEDGATAFADTDRAASIGEALACLHLEPCTTASVRTPGDDARDLRAVARGLADLLPKHAARLQHLAHVLGDSLQTVTASTALIHGDFAARQVVFSAQGPSFTDLDQATGGHPARDLGSFLADLEYRVIAGDLDRERAEQVERALLAGYATVSSVPREIEAYRAAALLQLAPLPFRTRARDWATSIERIVARCEALPWRSVPVSTTAWNARPRTRPVHRAADPSAAGGDTAMPWLSTALDPARVSRLFAELPWGRPDTVVRSVHIRRHKPGRRCLIQYDVSTLPYAVLGKTRAKGLDARTARLTETLRGGDFGEDCRDRIVVPPFLGIVGPLRMWLQGAVSGESASTALNRGNGEAARRLIEAITKLQQRGPLPARTHTNADELQILETRLSELGRRRPRSRSRLVRLFDGCCRLAASLSDALVPAHRDYHPDQVLIDGERLALLDLDLYALAHPALDAGNCIAHVIELGLRPETSHRALREMAGIMRDAVARLWPIERIFEIDVFVTLTLARLIAIDDGLEHRRMCVELLLDECERRLANADALRPLRSVVSLKAFQG